jgi:hypothetical protein
LTSSYIRSEHFEAVLLNPNPTHITSLPPLKPAILPPPTPRFVSNMRASPSPFALVVLLATTATRSYASAQAPHGSGEEGTTQGPIQFLWPSDRKWTAQADNTGPCGSPDGPTNRTEFPISQGQVAFSIADEAWRVAVRVAIGDGESIQAAMVPFAMLTSTNGKLDPQTQDEFRDQVVNNVSEVDPGHQCYKIDPLDDDVQPGTNATIQLEYWSTFENENNGNNQSFFACADIVCTPFYFRFYLHFHFHVHLYLHFHLHFHSLFPFPTQFPIPDLPHSLTRTIDLRRPLFLHSYTPLLQRNNRLLPPPQRNRSKQRPPRPAIRLVCG